MSNSPEFTEKLTSYRREIDALDDEIIDLLLRRIEVVRKVGELKRVDFPGICPVRSGREATMIRRVVEKFQDTHFSPAAAAAIWRTLIGVSTSVESTLRICAFVTEHNSDLFWLAREYFGSSLAVSKQPHVKRVIGDVMDGKASIGIVPLLRSDDTNFWWTNLLQSGADAPKIFAHIPYVYTGMPTHDTPGGLAIARIHPEATGDDRSIYVLEVDANVSQHRLQTELLAAKLDATAISIATLVPTSRHHLVEIKGFHTPQDAPMKALAAALAGTHFHAHFLGAYAVPIILPTE